MGANTQRLAHRIFHAFEENDSGRIIDCPKFLQKSFFFFRGKSSLSVLGGHRSDRRKADGLMTSDRVLEDGGANRMTGRRTALFKA